MAIFRRHDQGDQKTSEAPSAAAVAHGERPGQAATMTPPFVSKGPAPQTATTPGVVPPAAAPVYSVRTPDTALRFELDAESLASEKAQLASAQAQQAAQDIVHRKVRVAVQRTRSQAAAANGAARRTQQVTRAVACGPAYRGFDPVRAAQAGLLNLAWSWQQAGAPIRAIHAYMQVLDRYPETPAADAAVADLVELSDILTRQGQFHMALAIYEELEQLV